MDRSNETHEDTRLRKDVIATCREMICRGLTHGHSGNVSVRRGPSTFFISPTGVSPAELDDIPVMDFEGGWYGRLRPSSEWRFHRDIFTSRPDVTAVVHTHSRYATALACIGNGIPAFHYMVAVAGGEDIRCSPYATFGSQALSDYALAALKDRKACLLGNHGVIATGESLSRALDLAEEVENLAAQYCAALNAGTPRLLESAEMERVLAQFRTYGKQDADTDAGLRRSGATAPDRR